MMELLEASLSEAALEDFLHGPMEVVREACWRLCAIMAGHRSRHFVVAQEVWLVFTTARSSKGTDIHYAEWPVVGCPVDPCERSLFKLFQDYYASRPSTFASLIADLHGGANAISEIVGMIDRYERAGDRADLMELTVLMTSCMAMFVDAQCAAVCFQCAQRDDSLLRLLSV